MNGDKKNISSVIDDIDEKLNNTKKNSKLDLLRDENFEIFCNLDISFTKTVDIKYKNIANSILDKYNRIDINRIFVYDEIESKNINLLLRNISKNIDELKKIIKSDLITVIDYVDKLANKVDISNVSKNSSLGIFIINKYNAFKIYSADLDLFDINSTMQKQAKRLMYLKELNYLISMYNNINSKYNSENTFVLINNLYEIIGKYLHILTESEFEYTKEAIKKMLSYKFDFIDNYLPTYKVILIKIWNSIHTKEYLFICNLDLNNDDIYLMNINNYMLYSNSGYICDVPKDFISYFNMNNIEVINYPLPSTLKDKYELKLLNFDKKKVNLKAMYTFSNKIAFKNILPVKKIDKSTFN